MINRREALLGALLAPLIKPVASMLPEKVVSSHIPPHPGTVHTNLYKITDQLSTGEVRVHYKWIEEDFYAGETWTDSQVHGMLG